MAEEAVLRLAEAMVFSSASPVTPRALARVLPDGADAEAVIAALRARYAGRGVELAEVAGGVQFRTAPDLAPALRKVIEVPRRLTRVAMETLAIVAYHQPVTRPEIEHLRGTSLSQQTLEALLESRLIAPAGRKDAPGRPTLWATTPEFLAAFGLTDLRSLPRREDLFVEPPRPTGSAAANDVGAVGYGGGPGPSRGGEPRVAEPAGQASTPEIEVPGTEIPGTEIPEAEIPEAEIPGAAAPDTEAPDRGAPDRGGPDRVGPDGDTPNPGVPDGDAPRTGCADAPATKGVVPPAPASC